MFLNISSLNKVRWSFVSSSFFSDGARVMGGRWWHEPWARKVVDRPAVSDPRRNPARARRPQVDPPATCMRRLCVRPNQLGPYVCVAIESTDRYASGRIWLTMELARTHLRSVRTRQTPCMQVELTGCTHQANSSENKVKIMLQIFCKKKENVIYRTSDGRGMASEHFFMTSLVSKRRQILPFLPQKLSSSQKMSCVSEETINPIQLNLPPKTFANVNPSHWTFASYCGKKKGLLERWRPSNM